MAAATALSAAAGAEGRPDVEPVVCIDGLAKRYRRRVALDGVSLRVARGELYGLIGADGAGKSSLFKAVAGVLSFEGGTLQVLGQRVASERDAERVKPRIGFMPQGLGLNLYPELSVDENIDFFADLRGVPPAARAERKAGLLALTRLEAFRARPMKQLSGGMKQKLGLVCTLIHEPELLVLDEPTTGVDPLSRRDFWRLLPELVRERGLTALVSTAYLDEAGHFDRVGLMHAGALLAQGDPEQLPQQAGMATLEDVFIARVQARVLAPVQTRAQVPAGPPAPADLPPGRAPAGPGVAAPAAGPAIEAEGLTRDFGAFRAADRVSFRVAHGEIVGLLGANGAGKTTVIKMLTDILPPSAGRGQVAGADMSRAAGQSRQIRQRIGYMSQAFSLYADLSVRDNLMLYAGVYGLAGRAARERAAGVAALGGLGAHLDDTAGSLPMGLRQRLALGCALLHRPAVLFLDEPTSGVDPLGRRQFWDILSWLAREEGVAILLSTHHMAEAERCDRLVLLFDGRVVADAPPAVLKQRLRDEAGELLELRCDAPARAARLLREAGHPDAALQGRGVRLMARDRAQAQARISALLAAQGIALQGLAARDLGMDEVFVRQVGALQARGA